MCDVVAEDEEVAFRYLPNQMHGLVDLGQSQLSWGGAERDEVVGDEGNWRNSPRELAVGAHSNSN